jgi:8-oxo-dGTP pyrophosphatase MutT (NUDIX family)
VKDPFTIPIERLPPGFAEQVEHPPAQPAEPRPAATAVLMRESATGPEVLLLRRHRNSGFVPGAYVFPGGRVDANDGDVAWAGTTAPPGEYWVAAVREVFEETGVLLARQQDGEWSADASSDDDLEAWRERLMQGQADLADVLAGRTLTLDPDALCYIAHWITPVAEPRRYDTRFFVAALPSGRNAAPDEREMTDMLWLSPSDALERFEEGRLPMVFPTVRTLQLLAPFRHVSEIFDAFRDRVIEPVLPRLVRSGNGVGIVVDQDER